MIKIIIRFVDGGLQEYNENPLFYKRYEILLKNGLNGKKLIHELITDDWGAPPIAVYIDGEDENGNIINEVIPYT